MLASLRSTCVALVLFWWPFAAIADCSGTAIGSPAQLLSALENTGGGQTLALAPGDYGALTLTDASLPRMEAGAKPTRICSADAEKPAQFTGLILRGVDGIEFENLRFQYRYAIGDNPISTRPNRVLNSTRITFRDVEFAGDVARGSAAYDNGFGAGKGLFVSGSTDIAIEGSAFHTWHKAVTIRESRDILFRGNDIHSIRSDGMNLAQVENVLIEGNHIHDFLRSMESGDHADMIQIWTTNTDVPSRNITIRSNLLNSGSGKFTQSIYISNKRVDKDEAGSEMFYRNTRIENNVIINAHLHGITVGATDGLSIANNTLIRSHFSRGDRKSPRLYVPTIRVTAESRNVLVTKNITPGINGCDKRGERCRENLISQEKSPSRPTHVARIFTDPNGSGPTRPAQFRYVRSGSVYGQKLGSDLLNDPD